MTALSFFQRAEAEEELIQSLQSKPSGSSVRELEVTDCSNFITKVHVLVSESMH